MQCHIRRQKEIYAAFLQTQQQDVNVQVLLKKCCIGNKAQASHGGTYKCFISLQITNNKCFYFRTFALD